LPQDMWLRFARTGELRGRGFGLAGSVIVEPSPLDHPDSIGELWWGGVAGTQWWIAPKANAAGLIMTQRQMAFFHPFALELKRLLYEATSSMS
jgi:CubicO group peptidase (beta-lactamase class C family)